MLMMSRSRLRWMVVAAGLFLLAGLRFAPSLPPEIAIPVSLVWLTALGFLLYAAYRILRTWLQPAPAVAVMVIVMLVPIAGTAVHPPVELAMRLPCPRNWGWLATWMPRSSPMGTTSITVDSTEVKICYGRPAARGRTMLGGSRVPFGRLWRTGANEPTTIITPIGLMVAGVTIPPGRTALYTIPGPESWEIILNASTSQWGIESEYSETVRSHELGRAIVPSERSDRFLERLTFIPDSTGVVLAWEGTRVRIPIEGMRR
jgi:DUF2911 family protein